MISEKITELELNRLREIIMELRQKNYQLLEALKPLVNRWSEISGYSTTKEFRNAKLTVQKAKGEI